MSYTIQFTGNNSTLQQRAAEGAFVIIASDNLLPGTLNAGTLNGHIYRAGYTIASRSDDLGIRPRFWPLLERQRSVPSSALIRNFTVYMVGKSRRIQITTGQYAGNAQDIAAYSTFISCSLPTNEETHEAFHRQHCSVL